MLGGCATDDSAPEGDEGGATEAASETATGTTAGSTSGNPTTGGESGESGEAVAPDAAGRLAAIPGGPPRLGARGAGCAYAPRCGKATDVCATTRPELTRLGGSQAACWHPDRAS